MIRFEDLTVFIRTAEAGSLSAAARALECSPAVASAALARLEQALGQRLLVRSTRSARLSPAGERYLPYALEAMRAIEEGRMSLAGSGSKLVGQLRIGAPSDLGRNLLREWLDEFQAGHPALELRLQVSDRLSDLFREPVDLALRYGSPHDASLIALPLRPENRRIAVASNAYLERHGTPRSPQELEAHEGLLYTVGSQLNDRWSFWQQENEQQARMKSRRIAEDGDLVRRWALDGYGIACLSELDVARDIAAGRLIHLLPDWLGEKNALYFVCAHRSLLSPAVIALREFLLARLSPADARDIVAENPRPSAREKPS